MTLLFPTNKSTSAKCRDKNFAEVVLPANWTLRDRKDLEYIPDFTSAAMFANIAGLELVEKDEYNNATRDAGRFESCQNLKRVVLPKGWIPTGSFYRAFQYCYALEELVLPDDLSQVTWMQNAFIDCDSLIEVVLPDLGGCVAIPYAFQHNYRAGYNMQLKRVKIGSIGRNLPRIVNNVVRNSFSAAQMFGGVHANLESIEIGDMSKCSSMDNFFNSNTANYPKLTTINIGNNSLGNNTYGKLPMIDLTNAHFEYCAALSSRSYANLLAALPMNTNYVSGQAATLLKICFNSAFNTKKQQDSTLYTINGVSKTLQQWLDEATNTKHWQVNTI